MLKMVKNTDNNTKNGKNTDTDAKNGEESRY